MPRRTQEGGDLCAVFIHAGAGYHSHQNEVIHLTAVNEAAKVAMAILKNGGDATDAVEMAIRLLEDKEITNAGYGSNLTMDGQVECDATIVDHLGRSGAVGAISQVKNPITVARLVLDESTKPLSLQRVPPNLLVGSGATDYAAEKGVPVLPPDFLVSVHARDRWIRWRQDLETAARQKEAGAARNKEGAPRTTTPQSDLASVSTASSSGSSLPSGRRPSLSRLPPMVRPLVASAADVPTLSHTGEQRYTPPPASFAPSQRPGAAMSMLNHYEANEHPDTATDDTLSLRVSGVKRQKLKGSFDGTACEPLIDLANDNFDHNLTSNVEEDEREDEITDTVGAIAVDCFGRIAAGSSSGGIGMKHKGRCGPAALVGIGTAVIPVDPEDPTGTCVATVTSGTGEHMATTTAAATAADRIYSAVRKEDGRLKPCNEDEAMHAMIQHDFMAHPGVSNSHCVGAIGILAVKKCRDGVFFYFGHNTDSFALASMHSEERKPVCTMSRSRGSGSIAQGGRVSRSKYARGRG